MVQATGWRREDLPPQALAENVVVYLPGPTAEYPLLEGKTTYYVCDARGCLPPVNDLQELL